MSETNTTDHDENDTESNGIKILRERAAAATAAEKEAAKTRVEMALLRQGFDPDSRLGQIAVREIQTEGIDPTNLEAIKTFVEELGVPVIGTTSTASQSSDAPERAAQQQRELLNQGSKDTAPDIAGPHPMIDALNHFHEDRRNGAPRQDAQLAAYDRLVGAAARGDERVLFDRDDWARRQAEASR